MNGEGDEVAEWLRRWTANPLLCTLCVGAQIAHILSLTVFEPLPMNGEGDEVAEWLWTANPLCSARMGSNPILVGKLYSCRGHRNPFK